MSYQRRMPQPGERWRLHFRPGLEIGPRPCGCPGATPEARIGICQWLEGKTVLIVPKAPFQLCHWCKLWTSSVEGEVAIHIDDLPPELDSRVKHWTVPYTYLEPLDWRPHP